MRSIIISLALVALFYAGSALAAINVNTASADQLAALTGIGEVKATAIIKDRKANGPYERIEQLDRVDGIGQKTIADLRDQATVGKPKPDTATK